MAKKFTKAEWMLRREYGNKTHARVFSDTNHLIDAGETSWIWENVRNGSYKKYEKYVPLNVDGSQRMCKRNFENAYVLVIEYDTLGWSIFGREIERTKYVFHPKPGEKKEVLCKR